MNGMSKVLQAAICKFDRVLFGNAVIPAGKPETGAGRCTGSCPAGLYFAMHSRWRPEYLSCFAWPIMMALEFLRSVNEAFSKSISAAAATVSAPLNAANSLAQSDGTEGPSSSIEVLLPNTRILSYYGFPATS